MDYMVISHWDCSDAEPSIRCAPRVEQRGQVPGPWVRIPRTWHPRDAIANADSLGLSPQMREHFIDEMNRRLTCCGCSAEPVVLLAYSSSRTGQRPTDGYCGSCLKIELEAMDGSLRSVRVEPYPGVTDPRFPDGQRISDVYPFAPQGA